MEVDRGGRERGGKGILTSLTCFSLRSLNARCAARFCSLRFINRTSSWCGLPDFLLAEVMAFLEWAEEP